VIYLSDAVLDRLPSEIEDHVTEGAPNRNELDITDWSVEELNVPAYPEIRIYKNAARRVCGYVPADTSVQLTIHTKPALLNGNREYNFGCADLK